MRREAEPWGDAWASRGSWTFEVAARFVTRYPIGTLLNRDTFEAFLREAWIPAWLRLPEPLNEGELSADPIRRKLQQRGYAIRVSTGISQAWQRLSKAGTNLDAMKQRLVTPFVVEPHGRGLYEVRSPGIAAAMKSRKRLLGAAKNLEQSVRYCLQGLSRLDESESAWQAFRTAYGLAEDHLKLVSFAAKNADDRLEEGLKRAFPEAPLSRMFPLILLRDAVRATGGAVGRDEAIKWCQSEVKQPGMDFEDEDAADEDVGFGEEDDEGDEDDEV